MVFTHHPDAALLILCGELRVLQEEWQRLWEATSDTESGAPADRAFDDYVRHVWPGYGIAGSDDLVDHPIRGLLTLRATTLDGMRAEAAAVRAIVAAGRHSMCCRDDECELQVSLLDDVAGDMAFVLGEDVVSEAANVSAA